MKIGQFAKKHHTSIDTIRHYMSLGLLLPEKHHAQYDFDENCSYDFNQIGELKKIGFTLNEIQLLILYRRIGKLTEYDQRSTYTSFFEKKYVQVDQEIEKLIEMKHNLRTAIDEMKSKQTSTSEIHTPSLGLPLTSLSLITCPNCREAYEISEGNIENGALMSGVLICPCHSQLRVIDGIIFAPDIDLSRDEVQLKNDLDTYSEKYIDEYINTTHIDYLQKLHAGLMWSSRHMTAEKLQDSVALELGSGYGYFMRYMLDQFPKSSTYIAVDHSPFKIMWLKKIIERSHPKCKVIFLCTDFLKMPLRAHSIDYLLDISGSSNYAFDYPDFLLEMMEPLLKQEVILHAYYIIFDNFAYKSKISTELRANFKIKQIQMHLKHLNYICEDEFTSDAVEKGGPLEDYFVDGEMVRTYLYHGKKLIKPLG